MLAKTFMGEWRHGAIVPLQPVTLREGAEFRVTIEDLQELSKWSKELYDLFAPAADELADVPGATLHRLIMQAVDGVRRRQSSHVEKE